MKCQHICQHDKKQHSLYIMPADISQNMHQNTHRLLAEKQPIRITSDFSFLSPLSQQKQDHIKNVFKVAQQFFSDLLKVNPTSGNLIFPSDTNMCGSEITVSSNDQSVGIQNSDIHIYVSAVNNPSENYIAYASSCVLNSGEQRPIFARIVFNENFMTYTAGNKYQFSKDLEVTIHEIMHVFGFSKSMFQYFKDQNGNPYPETVFTTQFNIMGVSQTFIQTPNVINAARDYYACSTLQGMPLENEGGSGSEGSHWERIALYNDIMGASEISSKALFTVFDAALLKDTGWYEVNDALIEEVDWGKGKGCDFIYQACQNNSFNEFCTTNDPSCDLVSQGGGSCDVDQFSSGCKYKLTSSNYQCMNDATIPEHPESNYQFGWESRCLNSDLFESSSTFSLKIACYKAQCLNSQTQIDIVIGSQTVSCTSPNLSITLTGFTGNLLCPDNFELFCKNSYGCKDYCTENGYCNNEKCTCLNSFTGVGCEISCTDYIYNDQCVTECPPTHISITNKVCEVINCLESESSFNCTKCESNKCVTCADKFYLQNGLCKPCGMDCKVCTDNTTCTQCIGSKYLQGAVCASSCDIGYSSDGNNKCQGCLAQCNTCTTLTTCDQCNSTYFLYNNKTECVSTCPPSYFDNSSRTCEQINCLENESTFNCKTCNNNSCIKCADNYYPDSNGFCKDCGTDCKVCTNITTCSECKLGKFLQENTCKPTCDDGYTSDGNNKCISCLTDCKICSALTTCDQCISNLYLNIDKSECIATCPVGQVPNSKGFCEIINCLENEITFNCISCSQNACTKCEDSYFSLGGICKSCGTDCKTCADNATCVVCKSGMFLQGSICKSSCDAGYVSDTTNTCIVCIPNCDSCQTATICDKCTGSFYLNNDRKECVSSCPSNSYIVTQGSVNECKNCQLGCLECAGINSCTDCGQLKNQDGICKQVCDSNYFSDATNKCLECASECSVCTSLDKCTECKIPYVNQSGICNSQCDQGYGIDTAINTCIKCSLNCATCNPIQCLSCMSSYKLYKNICYQDCPVNTYADGQSCKKCDLSCNGCTGDSNAKCIGCANTYTQFNGVCEVINCLSNEYYDGSVCKKCAINCNSCTAQYLCNQCASNYYNQNGFCKSSCDNKFFPDLYNKCQTCASNCDLCSGLLKCIKCQPGFVNQDGLCQTQCNPSQYLDSSNNCKTCGSNCQVCNNNTQCISCKSSFVNQNGSCQTTCNSKYYQDSIHNCQSCISNCESCASTSPLSCLTCSTGYVREKGICKSSCSSNYYLDKNSGICYECDTNCSTCSGSGDNQCITCHTNQKYYKSKCYAQCPSDTYLLEDNITCSDCNPACDQCYGSTDANCYACKTAFVRLDQSCKAQCNSNQYELNRICKNCDQLCSKCTGTNLCQQCEIGYVNQNGICQLKCNDGYYDTYAVCQECASNCKTCDGNSPTECSSCLGSYILYNNSCILNCDGNRYLTSDFMKCLDCSPVCVGCYNGNTFDKCNACVSPSHKMLGGQCVPKCPQDQYHNGSTCASCSSGCLECINENECVRCQSGYALQNKICKLSCDSGWNRDSSNQCYQCYGRCKSCSGSNRDQCLSCNSSFQLFQGQCLDSCPTSTYSSNGKCLQCYENCLYCTGNGVNDCLSCSPSYYKNKGQCVVSCESSQFIGSDRSCQDCEIGCASCTSNSSCTICQTGYAIQNGKCTYSTDFDDDDDQDQQDKRCHFTCKTCIGSEYNQCTSCIKTRYLIAYYSASLAGECSCPLNTTDLFETQCSDSQSAEQQRVTQIASTSVSSSVSFIAAAISLQSPLFIQAMDFQQTIGTLSYINKKNAMQYDETTTSMRKLNINYLIPSPFSDFDGDIYSYKRNLATISFTTNQNKISQLHGSDSFLVNCFILFLLNLIIFFIMMITKFTTPRGQNPKLMWSKVTSFLQLSFPTIFLTMSISELSICIFLQFNEFSISLSQHKVAGLVLAIFTLLYLLAFIGYIFFLAYYYPQWNNNNNNNNNNANILYIEQFLTLLRLDTFLQRAHFGFLLAKKTFQSLLIVVAYSSPAAVISILFCLEIFSTIYMAAQQPFKERHLNVLAIISNACLTILELIYLISTAGDQTDSTLQSGCVLALKIITSIILFTYSLYMIYIIFVNVRKYMNKQSLVLDLSSLINPHANQVSHQITTTYQNEENFYEMMVKNNLKNQIKLSHKSIKSNNFQQNQLGKIENMQFFYKQFCQNNSAVVNPLHKQKNNVHAIKQSPILLHQELKGNSQIDMSNQPQLSQIQNPYLKTQQKNIKTDFL